jgi:hypothetical protein
MNQLTIRATRNVRAGVRRRAFSIVGACVALALIVGSLAMMAAQIGARTC